ncbi:hypothetical protein AAV35_007930 [Salimicrobium jeotgali]|uniref:DUF456 domain-containing protein n=1 Tax=Salimicrobium jeotgali TaxID=1230341 RepID=K2H7W5_9BACI|nr:DUF456 family protein [Salimicrobium jeotgali]AKG04736.1 hypothetical protein AAV35_007930 [Salimicrobium jeotgali]EKE31760.1 hypothetical protein MJ3_06463 [Salimicrobium jeotgali]MBM7696279.1 uncharacterized protein YqgC (DUF456 family) [Salimicrobium jeotgali]
MEFVLWSLIIVLFLSSFVSLIFPIIPGPLVLWAGFLLSIWLEGRLSVWFWVGAVILTVLLIVSDMVANSISVKKYGGSKWGEAGAVAGVIAGSFVIPPFGILIVPFVLVFVIELGIEKNTRFAFRAAVGTLIGFLSGTAAKFIIQMLMIGWFIFSYFN